MPAEALGAEPVKTDLKTPSEKEQAWQKFNQGAVYAASEKDAAELVGPALTVISAYVATLPPPYGLIAAVVVSKVNEVWSAIHGEMKVAALASGRFLPLNVADKVVAHIKDAPAAWYEAAAWDKLAQATMDQGVMGLPVGTRETLKLAGFGVSVTWRLADLVYVYAKSQGAQDWQAAAVAGTIAYSTARGGDGTANAHKWVDLVAGQPNAWQKRTIEQWWKARVVQQGGVVVDAAGASALLHHSDQQGGGGGILIGAGLAAVAAKVLFF